MLTGSSEWGKLDFGRLILDSEVQDCGRLKISIGRPSLLRPEGGTTKPKRKLSPPGAGLRTAGVTEEIYVQAGAVSEALSFADINKPRGAGGEGFNIDALGHEKDLV